ncbi:hypothetical protein CDAR_614951 [Caerostris darwini]|uniref:Uncharacterized protein n=1 Tax=Caerostris darwini TaxID=1538125 RepID=A0AAV4RMQ4_9ARAC|nr:hypothetical protein CDAR_614951 [Caerostris darwini]
MDQHHFYPLVDILTRFRHSKSTFSVNPRNFTSITPERSSELSLKFRSHLLHRMTGRGVARNSLIYDPGPAPSVTEGGDQASARVYS